MKQKLFLLFLVLSACWSVQAQIKLQDSTVNVVAYFSKGDTLVYSYTHAKVKSQGADTLIDWWSSVKFRLAVTEEKNDAYKIEYTPLDYTFPKDAEMTDKCKLMVQISKEAMKYLKDQKAVFVTDNMGTILRVENYKDIQKNYKKAVQKIVPILVKNKAISQVYGKQDLEKSLMAQAATEQDVLNMYEEVLTLFAYHGYSFSMKGSTQSAEKSQVSVSAGRDTPDEYGTEDDYIITARSTTDFAENEIGELLDAKLKDAKAGVKEMVKKSLKNNNINSLKVVKLEQMKFWSDGWPKSVEISAGILFPEAEVEFRANEYIFTEWLEIHKK